VYLIDYGLANEYINDKKEHIKPEIYNNVVGTAIFASIYAHIGCELTRRDDMESLMYTLIYLYCGTLPWKNLDINSKRERHHKIQDMKEGFTSSAFADHVPKEMLKMLAYI